MQKFQRLRLVLFFSKADLALRGIEHMPMIQCSFFFLFFSYWRQDTVWAGFITQQCPSSQHSYYIYHQKQYQDMCFLGYSVCLSGIQRFYVFILDPSYILKHYLGDWIQVDTKYCYFRVIPQGLGPLPWISTLQ